MATTKLALYKRAITYCKATPIVALTDNVEARRLCDLHYDDVVAAILESGFWTHAMRTVKIEEVEGITEAFGYVYPHDMPTDCVRVMVVSTSEYLDPPLDYFEGGSAYLIESNYLWSDSTPLYMRYVSSDVAYGLNLTRWTDRIAEAAALELAYRISGKLTGGDLTAALEGMKEKALAKAQAFDALQQPSKVMREGRWVSSRQSRRSNNYRRA